MHANMHACMHLEAQRKGLLHVDGSNRIRYTNIIYKAEPDAYVACYIIIRSNIWRKPNKFKSAQLGGAAKDTA